MSSIRDKSWLPGRFTISALACMLLAAQLFMEVPYYRREWWRLAALTCEDFPIPCFFPWWVPAVATSVQVVAMLYSWARYYKAGRRWWYIAFPLILVCVLVLVRAAVPGVIDEVAIPAPGR